VCGAEDAPLSSKANRKQIRKRADTGQHWLTHLECELGVEHPAVGRECARLARLSFMAGDLKASDRLLMQAMRICTLWQSHFGRTQACTAACFQDLLGVTSKYAAACALPQMAHAHVVCSKAPGQAVCNETPETLAQI
jgi:hypothetical protein